MIPTVRARFVLPTPWLVAVAFLAALLLAASFTMEWTQRSAYPEVETLSSSSWTVEEYGEYLTKLAKNKGAVYAFAVLYSASFPFGIDTHALGHRIGYILHEEKGTAAITFCTDHYRDDSCVHAIVIQEFVQQGRAALERLVQACESIPRGTTGYADCFHGMGHGILAYLAYDYEQAITECKTVGEIATGANPDTDHQALFVWKQCVDGATMELMQGLHDAAAWAKALPTYMPESDLLMPCNASYMPDAVRDSCYIYLRPRLMRAAGIAKNDRTFDPENYATALSYCEAVPEEFHRKTCYGGFGMQFVYSINGNDNRTFGELPFTSLKKIHELCALAPFEGQSACTATAAETILGGSRNVATVSTFCSLSPDAVIKDRCYNSTIRLLKQYVPDAAANPPCESFPTSYWQMCRQSLTES